MNSHAIELDELNARLAATEVRCEISIPRWVNDKAPDWGQILTAHDVARLTRRPPWLLTGMAFFRRFPKKRRFRGRNIGWHKSDILEWMTRG